GLARPFREGARECLAGKDGLCWHRFRCRRNGWRLQHRGRRWFSDREGHGTEARVRIGARHTELVVAGLDAFDNVDLDRPRPGGMEQASAVFAAWRGELTVELLKPDADQAGAVARRRPARGGDESAYRTRGWRIVERLGASASDPRSQYPG